MSETAEERRERRARKEAEIRAKLANEARALNDAIFSGPIMAAQRERDERRLGRMAMARQPNAMVGGAPFDQAMEPFGNRNPWDRDAMATAIGLGELPGGFGAARGGNRAAVPGAAHNNNRAGTRGNAHIPSNADLGRDLSMVCPSCFRPIPLSQMERHVESCPARARNHETREEAGESPPAPPQVQQPREAEQRERQAVSTEGALDRRAVADAAERRLRQQQEQQQQGQDSSQPQQNHRSLAAEAAQRRFSTAQTEATNSDGNQNEQIVEENLDEERSPAAPTSGACVICLEATEQDSPKGGIMCPAGAHFTCDDCFTGHVSSQSSMEPGRLTQRRGRVICPLSQHGCTQDAYPHTDIARRVSEEVFAAYFNACEKAVEARVLTEEQQHAARGQSQEQPPSQT